MIIENYIVGILVGISLSILTGIIGFFKGKKISTDSIARKNKLYLPMIMELETLGEKKFEIFEQYKKPKLDEVFNDNYKYVLDDSIMQKLQILNDLVQIHNAINVISISHTIIVNNFKNTFEELYDSVIDGISYHSDQFGNEYECENEVIEYETIKSSIYTENIKKLILDENMEDYTIYLSDEGEYETYRELIRIFELSFNVYVNEKAIPRRKIPDTWDGSLAEYFASNFDFFKEFNDNDEIIKKYAIKLEIRELSQIICEDLKEIVKKIVKKYEKEVI